jgi:hypothetical protein
MAWSRPGAGFNGREFPGHSLFRLTTSEINATDKAAAIATEGAHVAPEKAQAKKAASRKKGAHRRIRPTTDVDARD